MSAPADPWASMRKPGNEGAAIARHEVSAQEAARLKVLRAERKKKKDKMQKAARAEQKMKDEIFLEENTRDGTIRKPKVFMRIRPLSSSEKEMSKVCIKGMDTKSQLNKDVRDAILTMPDHAQSKSLLEMELTDGLNTLGMDVDNRKVYRNAVMPYTPIVLRGGSIILFAYGHTGTGKTHTTLGYGDEPGVFKLACEDVFQMISGVNEDVSNEEDGPCVLRIRFSELYLGKMYDLLNDKEELSLRTDEFNKLHVRPREIKKDEANEDPTTRNLRVVKTLYRTTHTMEELQSALEEGLKLRAAGESSLHDQSSRSHALMEIEIVNAGLMKNNEEAATLDAQITKLGGHSGPDAKKRRKLQKKLLATRQRLKELKKRGPSCLGATMTFVDLAGADFDGRSFAEIMAKKGKERNSGTNKSQIFSKPVELQESVQINKELACLKDCISGLVEGTLESESGKKLKAKAFLNRWRETNLTRLLREALLPKTNYESQCIMIGCVSPHISQERKTGNTSRYCRLVQGIKDDNQAMKNKHQSGLQAQIRDVYTRYTDKTPEQVEAVLKKWEGKERFLIAKVWQRYVIGSRPKVRYCESAKMDAGDSKEPESSASSAAEPVAPTVASLLAKCVEVAESLTSGDGNVESLKAKLAVTYEHIASLNEAALLASQSKQDIARKFFEACESGQGAEACGAFLADGATFTSQSKELVDPNDETKPITTAVMYTDWRKALRASIDYTYTVQAEAHSDGQSIFHAQYKSSNDQAVGTDYVLVLKFTGDKISAVTMIAAS